MDGPRRWPDSKGGVMGICFQSPKKNLALMLFACSCLVITLVVNHSIQEHRWRQEASRIELLLKSLADTPPASCPSRIWDAGVQRLIEGLWNACFDSSWVSVDAMKALYVDLLKLKTESSPSMDLLRAMWNRIGKSSEKSSGMIERHRVDFEQYIKGCS